MKMKHNTNPTQAQNDKTQTMLLQNMVGFFCVFLSCLSTLAYASVDPPTKSSSLIPPSLSLYQPTRSLAAYSGLGAASPGDYSVVDVNPAVLSALQKQYLLFGNTSWQKYDDLVEFGVMDNDTTSLATLIRVRESVPNDQNSRDRRYTLGLSYLIPNSHLSFGLSADYEELALTGLNSSSASNSFGGFGFLYEFLTSSGRQIFFGAGVNRIFDIYSPITYDVGVSTTFLDGFYAFGLDAFSTNVSGLQKIVGSLQIVANQFLDLKGSYGYATQEKKRVWGGGAFFHAPVIQLFYTVQNAAPEDSVNFRQTAGLALNFVFQ